MTSTTRNPTTPVTGLRVVELVIVWLALIFVMAPSLGLYYERLAALYTLPPLGLVYAYCVSHRGRSTALLAIVATSATVLLLTCAAVFPRGSAA